MKRAMPSSTAFKTSFRLYLRLLAYLRGYRLRVFSAIACMALSAGSTAFVMYQLKPIMNAAFLQTERPSETFHHLWAFIIPLTLAAALLRALSSYGQAYFSGYLGQQVIQMLRNDLYSHFLAMPLSYFSAQRTGSLSARITNDVLKLQEAIVNVVAGGLSSGFNALALTGLLFYLDWKMALVALVVFPLALAPIYRFGRKIRRASGEGQGILADLNAQIHETLAGIRVVKGFGMEAHEKKKFQKTNHDFFSASMHSIRAYAASSPIVDIITTLSLLLLTTWLSYRVLFLHDITIGIFTSFFAATATLYPSLKNFNGLWSGLQNAMAAAERCFEILDTPDPMAEGRGALEVEALRKAVEFRNVGFEYVPGHPVLRDISFKISRGEVVALVGPSGGGKTTLADLIPRFYDPTSGSILWDGKNLKDLKLASLRSHIGLVTQETILFHDSILHNIAYGKPGAGIQEVRAAARAAFAEDFISNTPQGFNTMIGERGVKLSGGQRQRLAIARALLKNPPMLILDEATSALDNESERWVQKALDELMGRRTTLVIAHRLSTIRRADRILVIDKGRIVERGRHGFLLNQKGLYAKLYRMQFRNGGKREGGE
jgi:ATP-binding cassette, subfamily B, bacterial MsbA